MQAYACFTSCLKLDSGNVDALMGMGSLYKAKGMLPECVEVVTAALEVMPDNKASISCAHRQTQQMQHLITNISIYLCRLFKRLWEWH